MSQIIKQRAIVADDRTLVRADEQGQVPAPQTLPAGPLFVPFSYWREHSATLRAIRPVNELGVWLAPDDEPADLAADFAGISAIAVEFPVFRDGRGYSIARLLRERYGWQGELRAIGDVLRDQLFYLARCGFDTFAVRADKDIHDALKAFGEFSVRYQAANDEANPLFRRRATGQVQA